MNSQPLMLYASSGDKLISSETYDNFTVQFPQVIQGCTRMEVLNVTVPMTCYNIPAYEANLWIQVSGATTPDYGPDDLIQLTINTERVYNNMTDFVAALNTATGTAYNMTQNKTFSIALMFYYDATLRRITFYTTPPLNVRFVGYEETNPAILALVPASQLYYNLSYRLGFVNRQATPYFTDSNGLNSYDPYLWTLPSILRTSMIYVTSSVSQGAGMTSNKRSGGHYDILTKVPVNGGGAPGSVVYYEKNLLDKPIIGVPQVFQSINFKLLDDEGKPLGLAADGPGHVHITLRLWYD